MTCGRYVQHYRGAVWLRLSREPEPTEYNGRTKDAGPGAKSFLFISALCHFSFFDLIEILALRDEFVQDEFYSFITVCISCLCAMVEMKLIT